MVQDEELKTAEAASPLNFLETIIEEDVANGKNG